jgi:murE/murF fusion protein
MITPRDGIPFSVTPLPLDQLLEGVSARPLPSTGQGGVPLITGIATDHRDVRPGFVFMARTGWHVDSHQWVEAAVDAGAAAVVVTRPVDATALTVPVWQVDDEDGDLGRMAARLLGYPTRALQVYGVTGTNGKTTTCWMLAQLLESCGVGAALLGTVEHRVGDRVWPARNTTPDGWLIQRVAALAVQSGCEALVMEVSSHGLALGRVREVAFDVVGLTQLASDHLDFHHTVEAYHAAKRMLFGTYAAESARAGKTVHGVGFADIPGWDAFVASLPDPSCACTLVQDRKEAGMFFEACEDDAFRQRMTLEVAGESVEGVLGMPAPHNARNAALALAMLRSGRGGEWRRALAHLEHLQGVPGRMERVLDPAPGWPPVFVDYAHTADAVEALVRWIGPVRADACVVLGCGGDRDTGKRPRMAAAAVSQGHRAWLTADNPRSESAEAILDQMQEGLAAQSRVVIEPDRSRAIHAAVAAGGDGGVFVLGKGHERTQQVGSRLYFFDDRQEARRALVARGTACPPGKVAWLAGWDALELAQAAGARVVQRGARRPLGPLVIDSRHVTPGSVFAALPGGTTDGHHWLDAATAAGAAVLLVRESHGGPLPDGPWVLAVADVTAALQRFTGALLAQMRRRPGGLRVATLTGSNGKTTTRAMMSAVLDGMGVPAWGTPGNWNNELGVPLTLSGLCAGHRATVLEMGAGAPGDIAALTSFAPGDVAVLTSIGRAHLERMGSVDGIRQTKAGIVAARTQDWVLPASEVAPMRRLGLIPAHVTLHPVGVASDPDPCMAVVGCEAEVWSLRGQGPRFGGWEATLRAPVTGLHMATNFASAVVASTLLMEGSALPSPSALQAVLDGWQPVEGRQHVRQVGSCVVIDDTYNANPESMAASLRELRTLAAGRPCWAVLGRMNELGPDSAQHHAEVGALAAVCADRVVAVGEGAAPLAVGRGACWVSSADEALARVLAEAPPRVVVLVKASRGARLERVVQGLVTAWGGHGAQGGG